MAINDDHKNGYLISHAVCFFLIPILGFLCAHLSSVLTTKDVAQFNVVSIVLCSSVMLVMGTVLYFMARPRKVYLVDFACYKPKPELMCSKEMFMDGLIRAGTFTRENLEFQMKVFEMSGLGPNTYLPELLVQMPGNRSMAEARKEAEMVMFGAIDELFGKTKTKTTGDQDIGILVVNCSLFCPTPSLCDMVVNHYKLRANTLCFNLGGMGCSAGLISIDLARNLLQVHPNTYALIVSIECLTPNWYSGNNQSMLITNCIFRLGGAAILLSNKPSERKRSKYQLMHVVRTHKAADDRSYASVFQQEDDDTKEVGIGRSKDLSAVTREAINTNIMTLGPLILPLSEQALFFARKVLVLGMKKKKKIVRPDLKLGFEHLCIHANRQVMDELEKGVGLSQWQLEPSRMTLYRFGNTSSSSLWYEVAYMEAKGRVREGDRTWQIVSGTGFKCTSVVWRALRQIEPSKEKNPWMDEISDFPVELARFQEQ